MTDSLDPIQFDFERLTVDEAVALLSIGETPIVEAVAILERAALEDDLTFTDLGRLVLDGDAADALFNVATRTPRGRLRLLQLGLRRMLEIEGEAGADAILRELFEEEDE